MDQIEGIEQRLLEMNGLREANLFDLTIGSVMRGYTNAKYGQELYEQMQGRENEAAELEEILSGDRYNFTADGALQTALSGAAELLGQQARQWTSPTALAAGGGAAFAAGQNR